MKVVVTGGHVTCAIAVIEDLKKQKDVEIFFIGRLHPAEGDSSIGLEYQLVSSRGIPFYSLITGRLQRKFTYYTVPSLLKIPFGFIQALIYLLKIRPQVICSFGGYLSVPVVIAGWFLRIPVITHEQTVVSGLANRIDAFFARKIAISWQSSASHFPSSKVIFTGNPIRQEIFKADNREGNKIKTIYITGGNQGAHIINETVKNCLLSLLENWRIIHQVGDSQIYKDFEILKDQIADLPEWLQKRYFLVKYITGEQIGRVLNQADLIISRSGANIVSELAALGKPALFIPLPYSYKNEQVKNAQMLVEAGIAEILPQSELTGDKLLMKILNMIENLPQYQKNADRAKSLIRLDAAEKLAGEILNLGRKDK